MKAARTDVEQLRMDSEANYAKHSEQRAFLKDMKAKREEQEKQLAEEIRRMQHVAVQLKQKVEKEVKNAKAELKQSVYDEDNANNIISPAPVAGRNMSP